MLNRIKRTLWLALRRLMPRTVSGGLLCLAAVLFLLDHRFTGLTWGALALAAGAVLTGNIIRKDSHDPAAGLHQVRVPLWQAHPRQASRWPGPLPEVRNRADRAGGGEP